MDKIKHKMEHDPDEVVVAILAIMSDGDGLKPESLLEDVKDMLKSWAKRTDRRPFCPYCGEVMVRTHYEDDFGFVLCWLCGCKSDQDCGKKAG